MRDFQQDSYLKVVHQAEPKNFKVYGNERLFGIQHINQKKLPCISLLAPGVA